MVTCSMIGTKESRVGPCRVFRVRQKAKFDDRHSFLGDTGPFMDKALRLTAEASTRTEKTKKTSRYKGTSKCKLRNRRNQSSRLIQKSV